MRPEAHVMIAYQVARTCESTSRRRLTDDVPPAQELTMCALDGDAGMACVDAAHGGVFDGGRRG